MPVSDDRIAELAATIERLAKLWQRTTFADGSPDIHADTAAALRELLRLRAAARAVIEGAEHDRREPVDCSDETLVSARLIGALREAMEGTDAHG